MWLPAEAGDDPALDRLSLGAATHTQALVGALCGCSPPRAIVEERKALFTVHPEGVVLAVADQLPKLILHTFTRVPVAFAPGSGEARSRY